MVGPRLDQRSSNLMQTAQHHLAFGRWIVPLVLAGLILPLWLGAVPGATGLALGRGEGNAGHETAALTAIRVAFQRARGAESGVPTGQSSRDFEKAIAATGSAKRLLACRSTACRVCSIVKPATFKSPVISSEI